MYRIWLQRLQEKCDKCVELQLVFQEPYRRETDHTCHWGEDFLPLPEMIKKETMKHLLVTRKITGEWAEKLFSKPHFQSFLSN